MSKPKVNHEKKLNELRKKIDAADRLLIQVLAKRSKVSAQIGAYKLKHKLPLLQRGRWEAVLNDRIKQGAKVGLSEMFIEAVWNQIHKESIRVQRGKKQ